MWGRSEASLVKLSRKSPEKSFAPKREDSIFLQYSQRKEKSTYRLLQYLKIFIQQVS